MVTPVSARVSDDEPQALGATAGPTARDDRKITTARLLTQAAQTADRCERRRLQDEVVVLNMGIARAVATRYRGKGIADEDLTQAAYIALLKAARAAARAPARPHGVVSSHSTRAPDRVR